MLYYFSFILNILTDKYYIILSVNYLIVLASSTNYVSYSELVKNRNIVSSIGSNALIIVKANIISSVLLFENYDNKFFH